MTKFLFICKRNHSYGSEKGTFHGLVNSATFIAEFLNKRGIESEVIQVTDGDDIDRVVQEKNPQVVVIEALWATPAKMQDLVTMPEHRARLWIVRVHSKPALLALEGKAMKWITSYPDEVVICPNTRGLTADLQDMGTDAMLLPNVYTPRGFDDYAYNKVQSDSELNIACFGALRPLKNHLAQAIASIKFANKVGLPMTFHINSTSGNSPNISVLENLQALFEKSKHNLSVHAWRRHPEFVKLVQTMDMGLQVSLSESFNLVAADFVTNRIPVLVSDEIDWLPSTVKVSASSNSDQIAQMIEYVWRYYHPTLDRECRKALDSYNNHATAAWWKIAKRLT